MTNFDFSRVQEVSKSMAARQADFAAGARNYIYFKLPNDGDIGIVRFLGAKSAFCHQVTMAGKKYPDWIPSLDQSGQFVDGGSDCPLVQAQLRRALRGWVSLIWRDAPVYERDESGRMTKDKFGNLVQSGQADQIAVWTVGVKVLESLAAIDSKYKGLSSRDFEIHRSGQGLSTTWMVTAADVDAGPVVMTSADKTLEESMPDLTQFTTAPNAAKLSEMVSGASLSADDGSLQGSMSPSVNPFLRTR